MALLLSTLVTVPGPMKGGGGGQDGPGGLRPAFTLGAHVRPPVPRSKFQGRRREGGPTGTRPAKRPVLQARDGSARVVGGTVRLQARTAGTQLVVGASAEGGGVDAIMVGVAGGIGVARAGAAIGPPAKRRRLGPKVARATSSSASSLDDLARLAARSGGLIRHPPPRDPVTQPKLWEGGGV